MNQYQQNMGVASHGTGISPTVENCRLIDDYEECGSCHSGRQFYNKGEVVTYCISDVRLVAISMVDGNYDKPWLGASKSPRTWEAKPLGDWIYKIMEIEQKLDVSLALMDCQGIPVCSGGSTTPASNNTGIDLNMDFSNLPSC